mmetsp:Transcript_63831/g.201952  ORF Transcript_63831/g.201952 Transcript_63831/m.201952 type:complete len:218 (-) Transcript_63831:164-817(-)
MSDLFKNNRRYPMFKRNHLSTAVLAATLAVGSTAVVAQENVTSTATVTVQNAFTLTEVAAINFGTLRVSQDAVATTTTAATYPVPADGSPATTSNTTGEAEITALVAGTPGQYAVTNAAPFTVLTISDYDVGGVRLVNASAPSTAPGFTVLFDDATTQIVGGINDGATLDAGTTDLQTDVNGEVGFILGGVLSTEPADIDPYIDGAYTGNYTLTVEY